MRGGRGLTGAALLVLATSACAVTGPAGRPPADGLTVLARLDDWRAASTDDPDGTGVGRSAVVEIAYDEATVRSAWADNVPADLPERDGLPVRPGVYGDLDEVDLAERAVVVYSSGQSGSCSAWPVDVAFVDGALRAEETFQIPEGDEGCNESNVPYRVVLAVDRDKLPAPEALPVEHVVIDGRGQQDALVTTYPAG